MESLREAARDSLLGWREVEALEVALEGNRRRRSGDEGRSPDEDLRNRNIARRGANDA